MAEPAILRPKQAAQLLTVCMRTLYRLAENGRIGHIKMSEHVAACLRAHTFEPKEEER